MAKGEVDFQFRVAERLDSKARGLFALAGAVFAAAQALALREDVLNRLSEADRASLVDLATIAGVLLGLALAATAVAIFVRRESNVQHQALFDWLNGLADKRMSELDVSRQTVALYINLMQQRQEKNRKRAKLLMVVQVLCVASIAASVWELIAALDGLA